MVECDVAILGGGPAGATLGCLLKKYDPSLEVVILERERFPRDHVGESLLPAIMPILVEMEVWDSVEAADFPIKIGATYRWGCTNDLWFLDFVEGKRFHNNPRPEKFEGQRQATTFQVDRSVYDKILLDKAAEWGCRVFEETNVADIEVDGDAVTKIRTDSKGTGLVETIKARYYVDCTGESGKLRRALNIPIEIPTALRNIAIWDYWQDAKWAESYGYGGTHVQIMSLGWGWIWFIPITPVRTSIGLVLPADYLKKSSKNREQIYLDAVAADPRISELVKDAKREERLSATKDWNFLADRCAGENWFLAGDACGFADPVLSAGLTLTQSSARKIAYTILEIDRGDVDANWLRSQYSELHRKQIRQHIQFADYWYSSNGCFTDLKQYCTEIAESAGVSLDPETAFQWLSSGGFAVEEPGLARAVTYRLLGIRATVRNVSGDLPDWQLTKTNSWRLNLEGAEYEKFPIYVRGGVQVVDCYRRGSHILPVVGLYANLCDSLKKTDVGFDVAHSLINRILAGGRPRHEAPNWACEAIEGLFREGWIVGSVVPDLPFVKIG